MNDANITKTKGLYLVQTASGMTYTSSKPIGYRDDADAETRRMIISSKNKKKKSVR